MALAPLLVASANARGANAVPSPGSRLEPAIQPGWQLKPGVVSTWRQNNIYSLPDGTRRHTRRPDIWDPDSI
jgi:hypothetical protein